MEPLACAARWLAGSAGGARSRRRRWRPSETTPERLLNADDEPQNWLHPSPELCRATATPRSTRSTRDNVKGLKVAWTFALGGIEGGGIWPHGGLEGTPIVEDGAMYVTDGWGSVYKLDLTDGAGQAGLEDGPRHRQGLVGRGVLLRRQQPRRRAVEGQGDLAHPGRPPDRDRQGDRRGRLGAQGRRPGDRRGHHGGAAGGQGPGDHRRLGRRVRHPRLDRRDRSEHRQGGLAPPHHPGPGRARPRHLGRRARRLEDRRRLDLGHRLLRSRAGPDHLGRRQSRARLGRRIPAGRQSLHQQRDRARSGHRRDQVVLPVHAERPLRLRRRRRARAGRHRGRRRSRRSWRCTPTATASPTRSTGPTASSSGAPSSSRS